ncbi:MAG: hypothetical protein CVV49_02770 [Spirochaetae bacterium HGW-Spirochaetae-5]|jgi:hypothetical protein|nr:MAG: hypothetical protein CVV49_02770 [Spirochaetae bacterium HGW-Spirochaetae-5]
MKKKGIISSIIGSVLLYLSLQGVKFSEISLSNGDFNASFLIPIVVLMLLVPLIRALRLKLLFSHLHNIQYSQVFLVNNIGYLFIMLLPLRLGELAIPYLMKRNNGISMVSTMSVIFIERMIDFIVLVGFLFFIYFMLLLPPWLLKSGIIISLGLGIIIVSLFVSYRRSGFIKTLIEPLLKRMPQHIQDKIDGILRRLREGFGIIQSPGLIFLTIVISIIVWVISVIIIYCLFRFYGINLGFIAAMTVMVVNVIGISIPAGPGVIGNFQYSCIIALSFFGLDRNVSFIFSNLYYVISMSFTMLIGIISFMATDISFREIKENLNLDESSSSI